MSEMLLDVWPSPKRRRILCPDENQPAHDLVQTPQSMANLIVGHFNPTGRVLDPARGTGAFFDALSRSASSTVDWCELTEGRDFFLHTEHYNWIITNPPWSKIAPFLQHAMKRADHVVFLVTLTHLDTRYRDKMIVDAGFGRREALLLPHPPAPWPSSGFLLCAYHLERGYTGDLRFNRKYLQMKAPDLFG